MENWKMIFLVIIAVVIATLVVWYFVHRSRKAAHKRWFDAKVEEANVKGEHRLQQLRDHQLNIGRRFFNALQKTATETGLSPFQMRVEKEEGGIVTDEDGDKCYKPFSVTVNWNEYNEGLEDCPQVQILQVLIGLWLPLNEEKSASHPAINAFFGKDKLKMFNYGEEAELEPLLDLLVRYLESYVIPE